MKIRVVSKRHVEDFEKELQEVVKELSSPRLPLGEIEIIPMGIAMSGNFTYTAIVVKK